MDEKSHEYLLNNIRLLMDRTGLNSQVKLGQASGVSQTNLSNIMRGAVAPSLTTIERIAAGFGVEAWQLLTPNVIESIADEFMKGRKTPTRTPA